MVINMASAKSRAIKQLGSEDDYIGLKALNKERDIAKNVYGTTTTSLKNTYDNLLSTLANRRDTNVKDFNKGRGTVRENAFFASRNDLANLANRGLSGGLAQLSKLGNRMETGRQYSDLANTFYNTANEIDAQETQGTQTYNTDLSMAKNTLDATLANIAGREADARNRYKTALANLIEQIKTRDAMNYANSLNEKALLDAETREFNRRLSEIAGTDITKDSYNAAIEYYKRVKGGSTADATNYLTGLAIGRGVVGQYGPQLPYINPTYSPDPYVEAPKTKPTTSKTKNDNVKKRGDTYDEYKKKTKTSSTIKRR